MSINYLAVLVATMLSFVFLALYYSSYHWIGRRWLELSGSNPSKHLLVIVPIAFFATTLMCCTFAYFMGQFHFIKDVPLKDSLLKSLMISCGYVVPILIVQNLFYFFGGRRWQLIVIDAFFYIIQFAIFAITLVLMG